MNYQICFPQMTPPFYLQDQLNVNQILMISEWTMGHSSGFKYHLYSNILVQPGCYNKISQIRLLISNRSLFLTVLEAGKSKFKVLADSVSGRAHFLVVRQCFFFVYHLVGETTNPSGTSFKGTSLRALPLRLGHLPKASYLIAITLGGEDFNTQILRKHRYSVHSN